MKKVKKHLGILGYKPSAVWQPNTEQLHCNNCNSIPKYLSEKEWFVSKKWYQWYTYGETAMWKICADCYTPLKEKF